MSGVLHQGGDRLSEVGKVGGNARMSEAAGTRQQCSTRTVKALPRSHHLRVNDLNLAHSTSRSDADEGFISSLQSQLEHIVRDLETLRNSRSNFFYTRPVA